MKKIFKFLLIFIIFFIFSLTEVLAVNLEISCNLDVCSSTGDEPLFSQESIYPGWSTSKTIKAINDYSQEAGFAVELINLSFPEELSDILTVAIKKKDEENNIYEDNLTNLKNHGYLSLSTISSGKSQEYEFTIFMPASAGNEYQGLETTFNLNLGFELVPLSSPSPSPCLLPSAPANLQAVFEARAVAGGALGEVAAAGPAPGFEVLGAATPSAAIEEEMVEAFWRQWWWLLILLVFLILIYIFYKRLNKE